MSDTIPQWARHAAVSVVNSQRHDNNLIGAIALALATTHKAATEQAASLVWEMRKPFVLYGRTVEADILTKAEIAIRAQGEQP
jgi:hypothetical protein